MKRKTVWLVLLLSFTGICAASAWKLLQRERGVPDELPIYGSVPPFSLIERNGRRVQLSDLQGKVWIADFVFTSCHEVCPEMTIRMNALQSSLRDDDRVRLVSFSVDPEKDTPGVLIEYANRNNFRQNWLFLTGDEKQMHQLVTGGFFLPVEPRKGEQPILHSQKFILIDQQGRIRGYYDSEVPESHMQILTDVQRLIASES